LVQIPASSHPIAILHAPANPSPLPTETAGDSLLWLVLFLEESGPVLLLLFAILGLPALLLRRRYRRLRNPA